MSDRIAAYLAAVPASWRKLAERVLTSPKPSYSAIVKLKCGDCCHWDRDSIARCTVTICANHGRRPFQVRVQNTPKQAIPEAQEAI